MVVRGLCRCVGNRSYVVLVSHETTVSYRTGTSPNHQTMRSLWSGIIEHPRFRHPDAIRAARQTRPFAVRALRRLTGDRTESHVVQILDPATTQTTLTDLLAFWTRQSTPSAFAGMRRPHPHVVNPAPAMTVRALSITHVHGHPHLDRADLTDPARISRTLLRLGTPQRLEVDWYHRDEAHPQVGKYQITTRTETAQ
jgi:hypothetical protein